MLRWSFLDRFTDVGLLVLRAGIGAIFLFLHGLPRLVADSRSWSRLGRAVSYIGIEFGHQWWGLAAIMTMTVGAICLIFGYLHRPAALALSFTMAVATIWKFYPFGGWDAAAHPATVGIVCLALVILGPGKYSLDRV